MEKPPSILFLFLPSFQQLSVVQKEEEREGEQGVKEGERIL